MKFFKSIILFFILVIIFLAINSVKATPSSTKDITSFGFSNLGVTAVTTISSTTPYTIAVSVPYETVLNNMVASFTTTGTTTRIGTDLQISGTTANNFTNPVTYTVVAEDLTTKDYIVALIKRANPAKAMTSFKISNTSGVFTGIISESSHTIDLKMPYNSDVSALKNVVFTHTGVYVESKDGVSESVYASTTSDSLVPRNFSDPNNKVVYKVVAADGTSQEYPVTITYYNINDADITDFYFKSPQIFGTISGTNITVSVPYGTSLNNLVASYSITGKALKVGDVIQQNGITANNFTNPVQYSVVAASDIVKKYTVTVTVANAPASSPSTGSSSPSSSSNSSSNSSNSSTSNNLSTADSNKSFSTFILMNPPTLGFIDEGKKTISLTVPYGTNLTRLVPLFTHTGALVRINDIGQVSGVSINDFTNPVNYTVVAKNLTTQTYVVTVSVRANSNKAITYFMFIDPKVIGVINEDNKTITVNVPEDTDVEELVASFLINGKAVNVGSIPQITDVTINDFSDPVTYTVIAEDGTIQDYQIIVNTENIKTDNSTIQNQSQSQQIANQVNKKIVSIENIGQFKRLKGRILLKIEDDGKAYYIHPQDQKAYALGAPDDAFALMREKGVGIKNSDLYKIPVGLSDLSGLDTDQDGLPDALEDTLGTNKNKVDSDGDGFTDKDEILHDYNPRGPGKVDLNFDFAKQNKGRILLQVESRGEAWYINPVNNRRYFLGRARDAFGIMKKFGLGISNKDFNEL